MSTVLFTGAGASKAIGYPLTSELLPIVRDELEDGSLFEDLSTRAQEEADRKELQAGLRALYPGFDRADPERLPLITDVFSLIEYSIANDEALPAGGPARLLRFRDLLKQAITDVLLGEYRARPDPTAPGDAREKAVLAALKAWVEQRDDVGLVTTNYDIGLEKELYGQDAQRVYDRIDLGFDWRHIGEGDERSRPRGPSRLRVYKLHGSLDQLRCTSCGYVYFNPFGSIAHQVFKPELDDFNTCHCRDDLRLELHIVAPSFVREIRDANLLSVWRTALEFMRTAERWVIVGYSLPPEDLGVRSLLMRAYATAETKPEIVVVQKGEDARPRFELLFPDCVYRPDGLEGFLRPSTGTPATSAVPASSPGAAPTRRGSA